MTKSVKMDDILQETVDLITTNIGNDLANITIERAVIGLFFTGVKLSNGYGGVSYTPIKSIPEAVCCPSSAASMPIPGKITGAPVTNFFKDIHSNSHIKKSLAIATLNALSNTYWNSQKPTDYEIKTGVDPIDVIEIPEEALVVVIGALAPYLRRLKKWKQPFIVLELDPATLKPDELPFFRPAADAPEVIPQADVLIATGTTLINDTIHNLLDYCKDSAQVVIVGPTSSMLPEPFFKRGVDVLGGVLVTKPDELLDMISEGGSGYHFFGQSAEKMIIQKKHK